MKQSEDKLTGDLLDGFKRPVGRPITGRACSSAERQKRRRERLAATGVASLTIELPVDVLQSLSEFVRFKGVKRDDVICKLLRSQLFRKR